MFMLKKLVDRFLFLWYNICIVKKEDDYNDKKIVKVLW